MTRYYIEFLPDGGFGAISSAHDLIEADSWQHAMATWPKKVRGVPAYRDRRPEACFALPSRMAYWSREEILAHYRDASFRNQFVAPEDELWHPGAWLVRLLRYARLKWKGYT